MVYIMHTQVDCEAHTVIIETTFLKAVVYRLLIDIIFTAKYINLKYFVCLGIELCRVEENQAGI